MAPKEAPKRTSRSHAKIRLRNIRTGGETVADTYDAMAKELTQSYLDTRRSWVSVSSFLEEESAALVGTNQLKDEFVVKQMEKRMQWQLADAAFFQEAAAKAIDLNTEAVGLAPGIRPHPL